MRNEKSKFGQNQAKNYNGSKQKSRIWNNTASIKS